MFKNGFLVVCRELTDGTSAGETCVFSENDTNIKVKYTEDLYEAIALQKAMLVGASAEMCRAIIKDEDVDAVVTNLNKIGRDRISNSEGESFIFVMFGTK